MRAGPVCRGRLGGAAFVLLMVFSAAGPASLFPFVVADYALATLTTSYRVVSGMHYVTDVLAGAAIGVICGLVVPAMLRPTMEAAR